MRKNALHRLTGIIFVVLFSATAIVAQTITSTTDGATPLGIAPGTPAGSYALNGFDNVNLYNGGLNFSLPIVKIGGRGGTGYAMTIKVDQKFIVHKEQELGEPNRYYADESWWNSEVMFSMGQLAVRHGVKNDYYNSCGAFIPRETLTRLTFTAPDGTEYELRDQLTGGRPDYPTCPVEFNRGRNFTTADGTSATFISETDIIDSHYGAETYPSGYLLLRDGTRFRIDAGLVSWMRDRNGNKVTFTYNVFRRLTAVTDSLNRQVTVSYGEMYGYDQITVKGFAGAPRTIKIYRLALRDVLRSGFTELQPWQLFPELDGGGAGASRPVISAVELPNGQRYQFFYNPYGELARVVLPTGGASEYDWAAGTTDGPASGVISITGNKQIYRRVVERRVYPDGGTGSSYASRMTYSRPESSTSNAGYVIADQYNSTGVLLSRSHHYIYGSARSSLFQIPTQYPGWKDGKEYLTVNYAADGTTPLTQSSTTFTQRAPVSWWTGNPDLAPPNDVRVTETVTTIEPAGANLVSKQIFGYDDSVPFNNGNNVKEYAFGTGAAGALVRETRTTFVTASNYTDAVTGAHLRSLASQISVHDSGGVEKARTTYEYDNYVPDANHAVLVPRSLISGHDAAFTAPYHTRGNATKVTNWILSPLTQLNSYSQYDIAGNVVKVIDARGYDTEIYYADCYGTPNGEARTNIAPNELASQSQTSYAFATSVSNALNQTSYAQFDYYLGRPVDGEDINGIEASGYFNDALDRPTQVRRAFGTTVTNQTTFSYDDVNRTITTTSDLNNNNDYLLVSKTLYDGLGRTTETRQYEGGTNYIAVQRQYDALGRAFRTSNPFRPWQSETAVWTTAAFDGLSRVTSVTTPDSAVVSTAYSGNTVTVTDQAGKKRKSVTDAFGRLAQVYEDPLALNYLTSYAYDVVDNLTTVTQGGQTRTFTYDSLKRLKSAANPESGTVNYTYDNNGNLLTKTDARSISTTFTYDALNRPTLKNYSDTTPDVAYFYDAQALPAGAPSFVRGSSTGRLVGVTTGGTSAGTYRGYDALGRVVRQYQRTDSVNYLVEASYWADSSLKNETYPNVPGADDRRVVSYTNDSAGRLASLSSVATSYAPAASVSSIGYASHNALKTETYGNSLVHAVTYNNRLQTNAIKLGTAGNPTSVLNLTYNYGTTNNNGNLLSTTYAGGGLSYTQNFGYDQLNRLTTSQEGAAWSQTNSYDRYGNRSIVGGLLTFNAANNRITTAGYTYDLSGNLTNDTLHSYTFDAESKIIKVDNVTAYVYDGEGQRVRKLVGENTRFVYGIGSQLIAEFDGSTGNLKKEYVYGGATLITIEPTAVNPNGTRYTTADHLGSPRVVTNSSAGVVSRHDYMPFGVEVGVGVGGRTAGMGYGVTDNVRQKFTSYERDNESGLDYAQARYYAHAQGRFTSADPLAGSASLANPQTFNRYSYVNNSPLTTIDPSGMFGICPGGGQQGMYVGGFVPEEDPSGPLTPPSATSAPGSGLAAGVAAGTAAGTEQSQNPQAQVTPCTFNINMTGLSGQTLSDAQSEITRIFKSGSTFLNVTFNRTINNNPESNSTNLNVVENFTGDAAAAIVKQGGGSASNEGILGVTPWGGNTAYVNQRHIQLATARLRGPGASLGTIIGRVGAHETIEHALFGTGREGNVNDITNSRVSASELRASFTTRFNVSALNAASLLNRCRR